MNDRQQEFRQQVLEGASKAVGEMNTQLDRLMNVYGVSSAQTTRAGRKVTEALRNEVLRLAGTVMPPALDVQVQQELNLVAREIEIKLEITGQDEVDNNIKVDIRKVELEYDFKDEMNNLLVPEGTMGTDTDGVLTDIGRQQSGLFFLNADQSPLGGDPRSGLGAPQNTENTASGSLNAFDRFTAPQSTATTPSASDTAPAAQAARPDFNQDGNRDAADSGALVVVRQTPAQEQQASYGASILVADISVPIQVRGSEATPSRPQRNGYE